MIEIKEVYEDLNSKAMEDDVLENFADDKQSMLLALIKGYRYKKIHFEKFPLLMAGTF